MDTGNEELGVYTLINTYIPLGVIVPVCLSNKCLFFLFCTLRTSVYKTYVVVLLEK